MKVPLRFIYIGVILVIMAVLYALQLLVERSDTSSGSGSNKEGYKTAESTYAESERSAADAAAEADAASKAADADAFKDSVYGSGATNSDTTPLLTESNNGTQSSYQGNDEKEYTYDYTNVNVQYHDSIEDINAQSNNPLLFNQINVIDPNGNPATIPTLSGQVPSIYYTAGSQIYSPTNYVPNYEDSIYLSRATGMSTLSKYGPTAQLKGGFCSFYKDDPTALEIKCNALDINTCAATKCCVLLGGSKCVSGNARGPALPANYSDATIVNKDVYYYQGKCYGHCD